MKRLLTLVILALLSLLYASAQVVTERCWHLDKMQFLDHRQDFWRSHKLFTTAAQPYSRMGGGLYSLTEGHYGFGLYVIAENGNRIADKTLGKEEIDRRIPP